MFKFYPFVLQLSVLIAFWAVGSAIQQVFHLAVSGAIIGLLLLLVALLTGILKAQWIATAAGGMLKHLVLFFIPCVVGLIQYHDLFMSHGLQLIVTVLLSTLCVLVVTAYSVYLGFKLEALFTQAKD